MGIFKEIYTLYSARERRNIAIYIAGIMFYKFGLELFIGSITTLATDRFSETNPSNAFAMVGILQGFNQAMQCVGAILIAPLVKHYHTRSVLATAIFGFGLVTAILLICDAATGGRIRSDGVNHYGRYNPNIIFPVYCVAGVTYGMVELIRRVIPADIVGGHIGKLKRMDSVVHVMYEVTGTIGAFASSALIETMGNNYSFLASPICFGIAGVIWRLVDSKFTDLHPAEKSEIPAEDLAYRQKSRGVLGYLDNVRYGFLQYGRAVYVGSTLVLGNRKFCWLVPGYAFALFGHRYLENNIANIFAKSVLNDSSYQPIIVGGSNFGELLGATTVFFTANRITTPIPFIRLDSMLLLIVWYLPFYYPKPNSPIEAWKIAATFIPISFGWAAGDVSLAAYIQSSVARVESKVTGVSALGAVMSFLYVLYILTYAILSPTLGKYVDETIAGPGAHEALFNIAGVHFSVLSGIIFIASLVPKGALSLNPKLLHDEELEQEITEEDDLLMEEPPPHDVFSSQRQGSILSSSAASIKGQKQRSFA